MKIISFAWLLFTCSLAFSQEEVSVKDLDQLRNRMTGFFTSEAQSKTDSDYYNIHLHMVQIWPERTDGYWLYIEQAMATMQQRPYRQRVYHVYMENSTTLVSKVYEINAPLRFAGAWGNTNMIKELTADSLIDRQGCAIYLKKDKEGNYKGATPGKECLSNLRGASYATSEVTIYKDKMVSWDRGWNKDDKQVWGAIKGGYEFVKQKE